MSQGKLLWLSASPSLRWLDAPLIRHLVQQQALYLWTYQQSPDESGSLTQAVQRLHDYLVPKTQHPLAVEEPVHLIGHGISGVIGLLLARRYPDLVRSLTLLAVAAQPAATWHSHYYVQRNLFRCSQRKTLQYMVYHLFPQICSGSLNALIEGLAQDLSQSPCPHSLLRTIALTPGGVEMPLLLIGGQLDGIVDPNTIYDWYDWLKPTDGIWLCPQGRHFFHYDFPAMTGRVIHHFLRQVENATGPCAEEPEVPLAIARREIQ
ncbi:alpha/beta fold hydrolase [Lyngbya confervoides]|uniref:Alpha/beta hydrolase n=1 Tax=Lyngbya confervoides BDU141951 TaxID=1574623 RepID=A0ABD4T3V5_9CYAN|nr:alpha/beta hydrolase [Lyngbya confervoides]MCM1982917.1 alpha/beta hydrolase [Lyngbya confervoides BDU141951]